MQKHFPLTTAPVAADPTGACAPAGPVGRDAMQCRGRASGGRATI